MQKKRIINVPSGNIFDIRYLFTILASIDSVGGVIVNNSQTDEYFKNSVNEYNNRKDDKYGFSHKSKEVNVDTIKHIVYELKYLELIKREEKQILLTKSGKEVTSLIRNKNALELKKIFTQLMLSKYIIFDYFLRKMKQFNNGIPIPIITSEIFDKYSGNLNEIIKNYIKAINTVCHMPILKTDILDELLEDYNEIKLEQRTEKIKKLQTIIERYVVSSLFFPKIKSRRTYDFVRARTTFLGLTNFANFNYDGFIVELLYPIFGFENNFKHTFIIIDMLDYQLFINSPLFEEIKNEFRKIDYQFC